MLNDEMIFEQPATPVMKACLRVETLFTQLKGGDSHLAMLSLLDLIKVLERSQLKASLTKELQQHLTRLLPLAESPHIDQRLLGKIIAELEQSLDAIRSLSGKLTGNLRQNEFLHYIANQLCYPASCLSFETPNYYLWLQSPLDIRQGELQQWRNELATAETAVNLILRLVRENNPAEIISAEQGQYHQTIERHSNCQLIRITQPKSCLVFPKIILSKQRLHIQYYQPVESSRPQHYAGAIDFKLTVCRF